MTRLAVNGVELNVEVDGSGPNLLLLHGFTGDVSTWEPFLDVWSGYTTVRVDVIGHGASESPADPERYTMAQAVEDLVALLDRLGIDKTALLGYSMGGRIALHLALAIPERLTALLIESASPGIADEAERTARVAADNALAVSLERDGLEAFVDRWQAQALFASQSQLAPEVFERQRQQRLANSALGLANSLRGMGAGRQEYLLPRLRGLSFRPETSFPTLVLAGGLDERYVKLAGTLSRTLPNASLEIIDGAGHAAHLEQPAAFERAVTAFLTAHHPASTTEVRSA